MAVQNPYHFDRFAYPGELLGGSDEYAYTWKPLEFLNAYRFLISVVLSALFYVNALFPPLASRAPLLFFGTSIAYLGLSVIFALMLRWQQPAFRIQVYLQLLTDIAATILLMHASGGVSSGIGNLLIIAVAGGSVVLPGRQALLLAALASFAVLGEQLYTETRGLATSSTYTQAGLLGMTLFITAAAAHLFARRIRESEALAKRRGVDLANMAELTEHVIQRMQTGIVVVDGEDRIRLINESAWKMLGMPSTAGGPPLAQVSPRLDQCLQTWRNDPDRPIKVIQPAPLQPKIRPRFARLSQEERPATLIFLEDTSAMAQQAQQMQLASLGRLTASIAHEIRNPLGAISHAGQLLSESPNLDRHDTRLTEIITEQSRRMNTIIESVLQLGRRTRTQPELIDLGAFLRTFARDFVSGHKLDPDSVRVTLEQPEMPVRFDPVHLHQILTNLCENALRYSRSDTQAPRIALRGGLSPDHHRPYLDVVDNGPGISPADARHIFEPFFTTSNSGSGLGLFISRELAEANQAHLDYIPLSGGGSCFRISFQDPRRQMTQDSP